MPSSDFVAVRRISTRDDETLAAVGETCDRVPSEALEWLEASGAIQVIGAGPVLAAPAADDDEGGGDG